MFTGIVEELGKFKGILDSGDSISASISCSEILHDVKTGDSIAVNGVCLTVTGIEPTEFKADVMPETLRKTNLGKLKTGDFVNLERALKASGRFGGHIVSGHIDGTAIISHKEVEKNAILMSFSASDELVKYIIKKGSVAIDGISLTVTFASSSAFGVSLIPLTAKLTSIGHKKVGDEVNVECDIVGKYIERFITDRHPVVDSKITQNFLKEHGFTD